MLAVVLCLLYNLEPVRLKRRGPANPITLALFFGLLPALAGYLAVRPDIDADVWSIFIGLTVVLCGRTLWVSIPDRHGDAASGVATVVVRYGARRAQEIACLVTVIGFGLLCWGLLARYGPVWALLGVACGVALVTDLFVLRRRILSGGVMGSLRTRSRMLLPVTLFDVVLVVIPLAA